MVKTFRSSNGRSSSRTGAAEASVSKRSLRSRLFPWALLLAGGGALACSSIDPFEQSLEPVLPLRGAVTSEHPLATKAGLLVLEAGGNAADAAVATALALAVVYPQAGNLGGGGFAIWVPAKDKDEKKKPVTIDFRETAPRGLSAGLYLDGKGEVVKSRSLTTPLAVGIPGSPLGLYELYREHGSRNLSFAQLCKSAISLAEAGFGVDEWLAAQLQLPSIRELLTADPGARALFYPGGIALAEGDTLVQPALARTLRRMSGAGAAGFYRGFTAQAIVRDLADADKRAGGVAAGALMDLQDLLGYTAKIRPPVAGVFRGQTVIGMAPPSSGGIALLQILGMLEGLPMDTARQEAQERVALGLDEEPTVTALGRVSRGSIAGGEGPSLPSENRLAWEGIDTRQLHWWIEAMRRAFADRAVHLGDPDHVKVPVSELLSPSWIAERRVSISERADLQVAAWAPDPPAESSETTHICVVDSSGNAVSLTTTLNGSFGSGIYVDDAGFLLNNELDDFSIQAGTPNVYGLVGSAANQLAPHRRPLSSMCPIVVLNERGDVTLVLGAPGGPRIITAVTQVLLRILVYGQSLTDAIRAPRVHQQWRPQETRFELGWDPRLLDELQALHDQPIVPPSSSVFGSVQGIRIREGGVVEAYSDPRRGGAGGLEGEDPAPPAHPR